MFCISRLFVNNLNIIIMEDINNISKSVKEQKRTSKSQLKRTNTSKIRKTEQYQPYLKKIH